MAKFDTIKAAWQAVVEAFYALAPTDDVNKKIRLVMGDPGTSAPYNTVVVDGRTWLAGTAWTQALDPSNPGTSGPDPAWNGYSVLSWHLRGLENYLHRVHTDTVDPGVNDDETEGFYPGSRWFNVAAGTSWDCHESAAGSAVWIAGGGGGGGGGGYSDEQARDAVGAMFTDTATISWTYNDPANTVEANVIAGSITNAKIRDSVGLSVIGRSAATTGNVGDVTASSNGDVLRMAGGVLGWGAIPEASVTNLVTDLATITTSLGTKADATIVLTGTSPVRIDGGNSGDLSNNRTISVNVAVASGVGHAPGLVPDPPAVAGTTKFLREDMTFAVPPGGGGGGTGNSYFPSGW